MNEQEIRAFLKKLREQLHNKYKNKDDEEIDAIILDGFFKSYLDDEMCRNDLEVLTLAMGYEPKKEVLDEIDRQKNGGK